MGNAATMSSWFSTCLWWRPMQCDKRQRLLGLFAIRHVQPPPPAPVQPAHDAVVVLDGRRGRLEGVVGFAADPAGVLGVADELGQDVALRLEAPGVELPPEVPVEPQELDQHVVVVVHGHTPLQPLGLVPREIPRVRRLQLVDALEQDRARKVLVSSAL
ncbi:hypothetical protein PG993_004330 [Apiospora rasikravindrae]|uniref:Secreted protein n=1 Tax=Apiospora rasikravindrae TaxID=990691 RepID=A0ABR1TCG2_9PEZI